MSKSDEATILEWVLCVCLLACFAVIIMLTLSVNTYYEYTGKTNKEIEQMVQSCPSGDCKLELVVTDNKRRVILPLCRNKNGRLR